MENHDRGATDSEAWRLPETEELPSGATGLRRYGALLRRYIDRRSRTGDQMVQAARSGVQNIAEGSQASGTSKKSELKLTNVARASLEELRLDYEDFLRQRGLPQWPPDHPALMRFKAKRIATMEDMR